MKKLKKLIVLSHESDIERLLFSLMEQNCVSLIPDELNHMGFTNVSLSDLEEKIEKLKERSVLAEACITKLATDKKTRCEKVKTNFRDALFNDNSNLDFAIKQSDEITKRHMEISNEKKILYLQMQKLVPYMDYTLPLGLRETESTAVFLGYFKRTVSLEAIGKKLYAVGAVADNFCTTSQGIYVFVICHKDDYLNVEKVLMEFGFKSCDFDTSYDKAAIEHGKLLRKIDSLDVEVSKMNDTEYAKQDLLSSIKIIYDTSVSYLNYLDYYSKMETCMQTIRFEAYVSDSDIDLVESILATFSCAYEFLDISKKDIKKTKIPMVMSEKYCIFNEKE